MRIFRHHTERPEPAPEVQWTNPLGTVVVDTERVLENLKITMQSGELRSAVLKTAEDLNPIIARKVALEALTNWMITSRKSNCEDLERAHQFVDHLVPEEVVTQSEAATEEHSKKLRYSLYLLEANNDDHDQAIKAGIEIISQAVECDYSAACTPEAQTELGREFEVWARTQ